MREFYTSAMMKTSARFNGGGCEWSKMDSGGRCMSGNDTIR